MKLLIMHLSPISHQNIALKDKNNLENKQMENLIIWIMPMKTKNIIETISSSVRS
jgi:hypothetical protein